MLAALAAGFGGAFAVLGEIAAAAAMTALLAVVAILGLLLPIAVVGVLAALLAGLDMLFVGFRLGWAFFFSCRRAPRQGDG